MFVGLKTTNTMNLTQKLLIEKELKNQFDEQVCLSLLIFSTNRYGISGLDMGFHQDLLFDYVDNILENIIEENEILEGVNLSELDYDPSREYLDSVARKYYNELIKLDIIETQDKFGDDIWVWNNKEYDFYPELENEIIKTFQQKVFV
jgi:signal transduction protein with GAF and PtsI domain